MLAFTLLIKSSGFATHSYKTSLCDKAVLKCYVALKLPKASSFAVDLAVNLTDLQSPPQQHYKIWKYEIFMTTNQYNDLGLLEPRIPGVLYMHCEIQNLPEILSEVTVLG